MIQLLLAALPAFAEDLSVPYDSFVLKNGLTVVLVPDHSAPIVHVNLWYHVGSSDEIAGRTGFAHLFEHLMFQGSPSAPGEYFDLLEPVGGEVNGTTSFDRTNFFETVPSQYLPLALFVESDRMGWLLDGLDQAKLDNQRDVVRNERRQRYENPPYGYANMDLMAALFPDTHPYHHVPIGSHADLEAATLDDVKAFFRNWYVPDNASLVIAGDFKTSVAKRLVKSYFSGIPALDRTVERPSLAEPLAAPKKIVQYQAVPERKVWVAWPSPAMYAPGDAELDLLSHTLANGKDSRLYYALVKEQRVAKDVSAYQQSLARGGMYIVTATAAEGHTTDEVVAAIDAVLADVLGAHPPTEDDLTLARTEYRVGFFDRISTIAGKADAMNGYQTFTGTPDGFAADLARYDAANVAGVVAAAKDVLSKPRVELHIAPLADAPPTAVPPTADTPSPAVPGGAQ